MAMQGKIKWGRIFTFGVIVILALAFYAAVQMGLVSGSKNNSSGGYTPSESGGGPPPSRQTRFY